MPLLERPHWYTPRQRPRRAPLATPQRYLDAVWGSRVHRVERRRSRVSVLWLAVLLGTATIHFALLGDAAGSVGDTFGGRLAVITAEPDKSHLSIVGASTITAPPVFGSLPHITNQTSLRVTGFVPYLAADTDRRIELSVNGVVSERTGFDATGRFAATVLLQDGVNKLVASLLQGPREIASASAVVILDVAPPTLAITRPRSGEALNGQTVVIEGHTEPGATVTVNTQRLVVSPDGTFRDEMTLSPGAHTIALVATDQAGNVTPLEMVVVARADATAGRLQITLDRPRAAPGQIVVATAKLRGTETTRADVLVSFYVGLVHVGSARTDAAGLAQLDLTVPNTIGDMSVIALVDGATAKVVLLVAR